MVLADAARLRRRRVAATLPLLQTVGSQEKNAATEKRTRMSVRRRGIGDVPQAVIETETEIETLTPMEAEIRRGPKPCRSADPHRCQSRTGDQVRRSLDLCVQCRQANGVQIMLGTVRNSVQNEGQRQFGVEDAAAVEAMISSGEFCAQIASRVVLDDCLGQLYLRR